MLATRPARSLGETRHVVVVFPPLVTFESDEVSVRLVEVASLVMFESDEVSVRLVEVASLVMFESEVELEIAVEFERSARHAGGGVGRSDD